MEYKGYTVKQMITGRYIVIADNSKILGRFSTKNEATDLIDSLQVKHTPKGVIQKEQVQVLGYTDSITTCGRCGRTELKGTYAVEYGGGTIMYLGSSCVKNRFGMAAKQVKKQLSDLEERVEKGLKTAQKSATKELESKIDEIGDFMNPEWNNLMDKFHLIKKTIERSFAKKYPYIIRPQYKQ